MAIFLSTQSLSKNGIYFMYKTYKFFLYPSPIPYSTNEIFFFYRNGSRRRDSTAMNLNCMFWFEWIFFYFFPLFIAFLYFNKASIFFCCCYCLHMYLYIFIELQCHKREIICNLTPEMEANMSLVSRVVCC